MNSIKKHSLPGYDKIAAQIENAERIGITFSPAYCQTLLRTADEYASEVAALEQRNQVIEAFLVDILVHLRTQPHFSKAARQYTIERAERILNDRPDGSH